MTRGIYIIANDKVIDQSIALLNSIRLYDLETPITLIPYDDDYSAIASLLAEKFNVKLYSDLEFIDRLSKQLQTIFGENFFARPNQFRKQACWFGEYDEFLYIDTDIVVFEKIIDNLNYLEQYDFLCCDYQHRGGIETVFTDKILEDQVLSEAEIQDTFNCGFWASKKGLMTEEILYKTFAECANHVEYLDFTQKTSDTPILNYLILKNIPRRFNIVRRPGGAPGNWAGSKQFIYQDGKLFDPALNQPLQYLHWAGFKIKPGCPYWEVWEDYRYLNEPKPVQTAPAPQPKSLWQQVKETIKRKL